MPKISHTLRRGQTYYVRQRIPTDLLAAYGGKKAIVRSLQTTDPAQARRKVRIELVHIESEFEQKRKTVKNPGMRRNLTDLSDAQIASMVVRWHQEQSKLNEENFLSDFSTNELEREEIIQTLQEEIGEEKSRLIDGSYYPDQANRMLKERKIEFDRESIHYKKFQNLLSRASLDLVTKSLQRYQGQTVIGIADPIFSQRRDTEQGIVTFGKLCKLYESNALNKGLKPRSLKAMRDEIDLLKNFILDDIDIRKVTRPRCREILETLKSIPINATKIYPGKSIQQAIEQGRTDNAKTMSIRTVNGHISRLSSLFKFAQDEMLLDGNPATNLVVIDTVQAQDKRISFSIEDLNNIFSAPLYTGCVDGGHNYNKVGPKFPRHARFWIPLIALYSGMRMEEICQLHASDIYSQKEVWVIKIHRVIKTKNSYRIIPVHPELIKIGFLKYVDKFRDNKNDHIFPDLVLGKEMNYSKKVSKWFGNFLDNLEIVDSRLCFHSFRHTYRDALTQAQVPLQLVRALCGWSGKSMDELYGTGVPERMLYEQIQRVQYEGLNISHLYPKKS